MKIVGKSIPNRGKYVEYEALTTALDVPVSFAEYMKSPNVNLLIFEIDDEPIHYIDDKGATWIHSTLAYDLALKYSKDGKAEVLDIASKCLLGDLSVVNEILKIHTLDKR